MDADHLQAPGGATETERDGFGGVAVEEALSEGAIDRDAAVRRISLEAVNEGVAKELTLLIDEINHRTNGDA